jgi:hypothetical protein
VADPVQPPEAAADAAAVLRDEDLPPIASLDEDSDYRPFLSSGVSEHLRQAALRKLFHTPKFNIVDGLDDYADDYRVFTPLGDIVTADMRHRMEVEAERMKAELGEGDAETQPAQEASPGDGERAGAQAQDEGETIARAEEDEPDERTDDPVA